MMKKIIGKIEAGAIIFFLVMITLMPVVEPAKVSVNNVQVKKTEIPQKQPTPTCGGGINKLQGPYAYFWWAPWSYGVYFNVWLSHNICQQLSYVDVVTLLLGTLGPAGIVVAAMVILNIVAIQNADHGNGVKFDGYHQIAGMMPPYFIKNLRSQ